MNLKVFLLRTPLRWLWVLMKKILRVDDRRCNAFFRYDGARYWKHSGAWNGAGREVALANVVVLYHVIEKGLTMPNRRLGFGVQVVQELMDSIGSFVERYGQEDHQLTHAVGVVKAYRAVHAEAGYAFADVPGLLLALNAFSDRYESISSATQIHQSRAAFYANKDAPFPLFAVARHSVRHYAPGRSIALERIRRAVAVAQSAPSACNRQPVKVYCIGRRETVDSVLTLQGGNRGFGHLADKVLIVTADLHDMLLPRERNDAYVNGGIFLMSLCYALYHEEVAHCILTWAQNPTEDRRLRSLVPIPDNEEVVALVSCGEAPDEFDIALSPRKSLDSVLKVV